MADKRIQDLTPASQVQTSDRFVLEQSGQAKSLTGQILINDLAAFLDGHGGINDISYTPPSTGSLDGTLTITLADETVVSFTVTNGRGISNIGYVESVGLDDYYEITYNDNSEPTTFVVRNGEKGDTGDNWYVHIKWSATEPTQDSDMVDYPSDFIGIYAGLGETAPTSYTEYEWYEYKGEKGDTGTGISGVTLESSSGLIDTYRVSFDDGSSTTFNVTNGSQIDSITKTSSLGLVDTYTVTLTNGLQTTFQVTNAKSITSITWTSTTSPTGVPHIPGATDTYTIAYNDGDTTSFQIYNGLDGEGASLTVDGIPSINGNVPLLTIDTEHGAPTPQTVGSPKSRYFDAQNSILYICMGYDETVGYIWRGAGVTVDAALSTSSTNPVQNRIITNKVGTAALDTTAQNLSGAVNEILDDISGFADNIADEYSATATYAVGDLCMHENVLYRCNTAISTPEAWNSIHWTQVSVDDAIVDMGGKKVSKSGDTMTGQLVLQSSSTTREVLHIKDHEMAIGTNPSSNTYDSIYFKDKNDVTAGFIRYAYMSDGRRFLQFSATAKNGSATNYFNLGFDTDGSAMVGIPNADKAAWRDGIGAVNIAGDTMTGELTVSRSGSVEFFKIKNTALSVSDTPSSNTYNSIVFTDKNDVVLGVVRLGYMANGNHELQLRASNGSANNDLHIRIKSDGTPDVGVTNATAWRNAFGLGTSGAFPITIAQGGSGNTATSKTTTASSIITAASGITILDAQYAVWGKLAQVQLNIKATAAISAGATVATIVSGKRPALDFYAIDSANGRMRFNSDGSVATGHSITNGTTIFVSTAYILP